MIDLKLLIGIISLILVAIGITFYFNRERIKKKFSNTNVKKWLSSEKRGKTRKERTSRIFIYIFIFFIILFYIAYYINILDLVKFSILIFGILLIEYDFYYFCIDRVEFFSIAFFAIIAISAFLIFITFYPGIITTMEISKMNIETAKYYHSMISDIILGFSAVIGIGLTLIYEEKKSTWRKQVSLLFGCLMLYFAYVMYIIFLNGLSNRIADLNSVIV